MPRFFAFTAAVGAGLALSGLAVVISAGCGASDLDFAPVGYSDASPKIDAKGVNAPDGTGISVDAGPTIEPSCDKYCGLIMKHCTGPNAQYASVEECNAFCEHFPEAPLSRGNEDDKNHSLVCRQLLADSPALTDPQTYCLQAGPFGDNVCGDRCNVFCSLALSICTPDGGVPAYETLPDCATHCTTFSFVEQGADGGGQGPSGPKTGDTLNCRLYQLRRAVKNPTACKDLRPDAGPCD